MILYGRYLLIAKPDDPDRNRQDMIGTHFVAHHILPTLTRSAVLIVCDGCGSSLTSEVGAGLMSQMGSPILTSLIEQNGFDLERVTLRFYDAITGIIRDLILKLPRGKAYLTALESDRAGKEPMRLDKNAAFRWIHDWIDRNFMFTIVAGYLNDRGALILRRGDGGFCVDGEYVEAHAPAPNYIGNDFLPCATLQINAQELNHRNKDRPTGFEVRFYPYAKKVALFTDGMIRELLQETWSLVDPIPAWGNRHHKREGRRNKLQLKAQKEWREQRGTDNKRLIKDDVGLGLLWIKDGE